MVSQEVSYYCIDETYFMFYNPIWDYRKRLTALLSEYNEALHCALEEKKE